MLFIDELRTRILSLAAIPVAPTVSSTNIMTSCGDTTCTLNSAHAIRLAWFCNFVHVERLMLRYFTVSKLFVSHSYIQFSKNNLYRNYTCNSVLAITNEIHPMSKDELRPVRVFFYKRNKVGLDLCIT